MDEELYTHDDFKIVPLEKASKTKTPFGEDYDPDNNDHYSEWAFSWALFHLEQNVPFTASKLRDAIWHGKTQQTLDELVAKKLVAAIWDETINDMAYYVI